MSPQALWGTMEYEVINMNTERKKQLIMEYKNRHPEMGVISLKCRATGEAFLGISGDTRTAFNSVCARLSGSSHPNRHLQELWNEYGEEGFEQSVIKVLKYEDPCEDHTEELELLREECLETDEKAVRIWK